MDDQALTADGPEAPPAHAGVRYALLRMILLLVVGAALYLVGLR